MVKAEPLPRSSSPRGVRAWAAALAGSSALASLVFPSKVGDLGPVGPVSIPVPSGQGLDPRALGPGVFSFPHGDQEYLLGVGESPYVRDFSFSRG